MDDLLVVDDFCQNVSEDLDAFISEVAMEVHGRPVSDSERVALKSSYIAVSSMLRSAINKRPGIAAAHIGRMNLRFEYRLPSAPAWCDLVILGKGKGKSQAFIVELKNWFANDDAPGIYEGLMLRKGSQYQHPSDQVAGYVEYCRAFHSAVIDEAAEVSGCVYLTTRTDTQPYTLGVNKGLSEKYPVFNLDTAEDLSDLLADRIEEPDAQWAARFIDGIYCQNRNILEQVARTFKSRDNAQPFVLLDAQRKGLNCVKSVLEECVNDKNRKQVIIVEGPPGSGKSAVAVNLWTEAVVKYVGGAAKNPGNVVYVSTNSSQKDNWSATFDEYSGHKAAHGFILSANDYNPGMSGADMKDTWVPIFKDKEGGRFWDGKKLSYEGYEYYTNWMLKNGKAKSDYADNRHFLSIVDEAHALINSAKPGFCTNKTAGWCFQMGPQAYHIIRKSRVSVFFIDPKQSFRDNESTSIEDMKALAEKLGAKVQEVSLAGMQFRCAGSVEYVEFVDHMFDEKPSKNHDAWSKMFSFDVVDTPFAVEEYLRNKIKERRTARLLSSYTVKWKSKGMNEYHQGSYTHDFDFLVEGKNFQRFWNTSAFVRAPRGSAMCDDPLCEVGCPYMVRGYDYDYVGVLSLGDIVWREKQWMVDYDKCEETATGSSKKAAREELRRMHINERFIPLHYRNSPAAMAYHKTILQAYRILLTRAVRGVCLYVKDIGTREHIKELLAGRA